MAATDRIAALLDDIDHSNDWEIESVLVRLQGALGESAKPLDLVAMEPLERSPEGSSGSEVFSHSQQPQGPPIGSSQAVQQAGTQESGTEQIKPKRARSKRAGSKRAGAERTKPPEATQQADAQQGRTGPAPALPPPADQASESVYRIRVDLAACQRRLGYDPREIVRRIETAGTILEGRLAVGGTDLDAGPLDEAVVFEADVAARVRRDELSALLGIDGAEVAVLSGTPPQATAIPKEKSAAEAPSLPRADRPAQSSPPPPAAAPEASGTIRIPVNLIDRLMTLAGELVLVRNQARRFVDGGQPLPGPVIQRLDSVTSELQGTVLQTRMQPVGNLFGKFPRLVRDLARQLGKEITFDVSGTELELDKSVLDVLSDPLTHLVRNCCDHGIEGPDERQAKGKPRAGRLALVARHLGDQIAIVVRDDGRGIDREAVKRQAVRQGLRLPEELARMSDKELLSLLLLPGFSTAAQVTDLSGRGVGMDVVKTKVDQLGGSLEIESIAGVGTVFALQLPMTLAIIPCLLVLSGGLTYAIPQKDLEELVCVHPGQTRLRIEQTVDQEVMRLRGRLLPLVRLDEVLRRKQRFSEAVRSEIVRSRTEESQRGPTVIAVVKAGTRRFGLFIDGLVNSEEIVVKPMHTSLRRLEIFSGATILGDGKLALILNSNGIAHHAGVRFGGDAEVAGRAIKTSGPETRPILLFQQGSGEQFAIPLTDVRKIVMVHRERIERAGGKEFLVLNGIPVRLVRAEESLGGPGGTDRAVMVLLLPRGVAEPVGLLVEETLDSDVAAIDLHPDATARPGVTGSAMVRGRLTWFLDLPELLGVARSDEVNGRSRYSDPTSPRVLLVEDTQFFRELVRGYLEGAGYRVTTAENGAVALETLCREPFDLVVSDLEMPVMDGWAFATSVRGSPGLNAMPLLALTTLGTEADRAKALACGYDEFEVKLERGTLLASVARVLASSRRGKPDGGTSHES